MTRRDLLKFLPSSALGWCLTDCLFKPPFAHCEALSRVAHQTLIAADKPVGKLLHGVGFNWFDASAYGYPDRDAEGYPTYPDLDDRAGWSAVTQALDDLRPSFLRFWLAPDPCVGQKPGEINTQNVGIERLQRVATWAEQNGCTVLLDLTRVPEKFQFEMGPREREQKKTNKWIDMAARDNAAYAREFVAPLVRHVLVERNLRAVTLLNLYNEPLQYGPFATPNNEPDAFVHYVKMYREIQAALSKAGLYPGKIRLAGGEAIHPIRFPALEFLARGVDIDPFLDVYTIHYYFLQFDWMAPVPFLEETLAEGIDRQTPKLVNYCKMRGKPLLAAEIGWFPNDGDPMPTDPLGSSRHYAALMTAESMVRGMNAGLSGFGIWSLFNPGTFDGAWQVVWVRKGRLFRSEHLYPTYRLFTRHARPGSEIFPIAPEERDWPWQYVHATALVTPEGKAALYVINDHLVESRRVVFKLPGGWAGRPLKKLVKDSVRLGTDSGVIRPKTSGQSSVIEDLLTPMSLTAYLEEEV